MSEPVGNVSRTPSAIPNNSHKAREEKAESVPNIESREELTKIVSGKVTARKQPWYKRVSRSLIADDATSVSDYILTDVFIPAIRNLIFDMITGSASRTLYGGSRGARRSDSSIRGGGPVSTIRTRYDRMSEDSPRHGPTPDQMARHDFREVRLDYREEAIDVLEAMIDYLGKYNAVSIAELYKLTGVTGTYTDQRWGWTDLSNADIRQHRGGWLISLPDPQPIRN